MKFRTVIVVGVGRNQGVGQNRNNCGAVFLLQQMLGLVVRRRGEGTKQVLHGMGRYKDSFIK